LLRKKIGMTLAVTSIAAMTSVSAMAATTSPQVSLDRTLTDARIAESSGLARSTYARDVLFTHNDSGDGARVFAVGANGKTNAVLTLKGAGNVAWEDISSGPNHTLWVGDTGNGASDRRQVTAYRFTEPQTLRTATVGTTKYTFSYPDGAHNAEAIMVHPTTGRVYVVTKAKSGAAIYVAPASLSTSKVNKLTKVASAPASITGASFSPDGKQVVLTSYATSYVYDAIGGKATEVANPQLKQAESVEFNRAGTKILIGSEGAKSPVYAVSWPATGAVTPAPTPTPAPAPTPTPAPAPTPEPQQPVTAPTTTPAPATKEFLFGFGGGNWDPAETEQRMGAKLMIHRIYHSNGAKVDSAVKWVKDDIAKGRQASEVSFKVPASWADMAAGKRDDFFTEVATKLKAAVAGTDHRVLLAFNHEPEDDFKDLSAAQQDQKRDEWKAMQNRAAGFFSDIEQVEFGVIFMGYHSFPNLGSALYPRWSLDNAVPSTPELDYIGLDVYEDANAPAKARPFETRYFKPMQAFAAKRGVEWGLSETGLTEAAFKANPTWFTDMNALIQKYDGSFLDYFNTNLNSIATWSMTAGDAREKAFGVTLKGLRTQ
jgi:hypothetical protein